MKPRGTLKKILIHFSVWLIYILYELLIVFEVEGAEFNLMETFLNFVLYASLFYTFSEILFPRFFNKKNIIYFLPAFIAAFSLFTGLRYLVKVELMPLLSPALVYPFTSLRVFMAETWWRGGYFTMFSFGYWVARNLVKTEQEKLLLLEKKAVDEQRLKQMEINYRIAQIEYLKNQINPHFLFNTLNFFYDHVRNCSASAAEGILLLSSIMRYALKDSEPNAKVMLQDEVKHLHNFIAINQLRFDNRLQIKFDVTGSLHFRMVIPLLLITFVENSFKYGDLLDPQHPLIIRLDVDNDTLVFYSYNKKKIGPVETSNGVGLTNTKKRLDLVYKDQYTLQVSNEENSYATTLKITL
jgi:two-component system LytT family sensor kinase